MTDLLSVTDIHYLVEDDRTNPEWPPRKNPVAVLRGWLGRWIERHAPVGFEDQAGFHYGPMPVPTESSRQPYVHKRR